MNQITKRALRLSPLSATRKKGISSQLRLSKTHQFVASNIL